MIELRDEIAWEHSMIDIGVKRFREANAKTEETAPEETRAGHAILRNYMAQVSEFIVSYCAGNNPNGRRRNKYAKIIALVDADKLALIGLSRVIKACFHPQPIQSVCRDAGLAIQDELRFMKFELEKPELYAHIQRRLDDNNSMQYRHRQRNLVYAMNQSAVDWEQWDKETVIGVGALLVSLCTDATDLVEVEHTHVNGRTRVMVVPSPATVEWISDYNSAVEVTMPDRLPTLIEPLDWTPEGGGFHSPKMQFRTKLVKVRKFDNSGVTKGIRSEIAKADMPKMYRAVNGMQRTQWRINTRVLNVMQEIWDKGFDTGMPQSRPYDVPASPIPRDVKFEDMTVEQKASFDEWKAEAREIYSLEKKRRGQVLGVIRTMRLGQMLATKELLYFVYQADFRSRLYAASSGVSPQGTDHAKAVLQFAKARRVGKAGLYWLKVHGANKYGYDKHSYDTRVEWIDSQREKWLAVASDPVGNREVWSAAGKPYQFLAWCFEYAEADKLGENFWSRMPVALDGSCNGLQHFSAMLRDAVGGSCVNLTPSEKPSDIYQSVADVCTSDLRNIAQSGGDQSAAALNWLDLFNIVFGGDMNRKLSKKPVMTLPYGSTQQACTTTIYQWYMEQGEQFFPRETVFRHCIFLSGVLWNAIGKVVIAARAAMKWLQKCATILGKSQNPIRYTTPIGFPMIQYSFKQETIATFCSIGGRMKLVIEKDTPKISSHGLRNGSAPNTVHSVDATHMMLCVNAGLDAGITDFAMIHDDFGVHPDHVEQWHKIIRQEFYKLHTEHDILAEFKAQNELASGVELPELPEKGTLDLSMVLNSPYFFG